MKNRERFGEPDTTMKPGEMIYFESTVTSDEEINIVPVTEEEEEIEIPNSWF